MLNFWWWHFSSTVNFLLKETFIKIENLLHRVLLWFWPWLFPNAFHILQISPFFFLLHSSTSQFRIQHRCHIALFINIWSFFLPYWSILRKAIYPLSPFSMSRLSELVPDTDVRTPHSTEEINVQDFKDVVK